MQPWKIAAFAVAGVAALGVSGVFLHSAYIHEETDNAFVDGHIIPVSPQIDGKVIHVFVTDNQPVKEGDRLICSFFLPESKQITATGEVVRAMIQPDKTNAKKYGVRFDKLLPDAKSAIEVFVTKKAQMTRPRAV